VLVEVHATAVNRADLLQARGLYPPPPGESPILGLEVAGAIRTIGVLGGAEGTLDMAQVLMKSLTLKGTRLRARSQQEKTELTRQFRDRIWPLLVAGKIRPVVDRVFPISAAAEAHRYVKANRNIGKVVLAVRP